MNIQHKPPFQVTTGVIPGSTKIHVNGTTHSNLRVPFRQITLHPSAKEPPVRLYDPSGAYTDPSAKIDIAAGLERAREAWVRERGDTEVYDGRPIKAVDKGGATGDKLVTPFPLANRPRRAKHEVNVVPASLVTEERSGCGAAADAAATAPDAAPTVIVV